ncbi:MAG: cupin domain-containing protein [Ilumatobacteraceae bacterium]|nr:cupin domain-containing protein [Ilumatobacteraceae bacterium]
MISMVTKPLPGLTWRQSPFMSTHQPHSKEGCTIFVKTGHLLS